MTKPSAKPKSRKPAGRKAAHPIAEADRRREWRFELPLTAIVEGDLPQGDKFQERSKLENISSGGAHFCLDSGVVVGSKINLVIDLPKALTENNKVKLRIGGITVRLDKPDRKNKKQGVAIRFRKGFRFISSKS